MNGTSPPIRSVHATTGRLVLVLALASALAVAGCGPRSDPVVDTWPVGHLILCGDAARCAALTSVGLAGLDARNPEHAAVVSSELHDEGQVVDPSTGKIMMLIRSGACCEVLVARLADGSTRAIGVGYPGISQVPIAIPWEVTPGG